DNAHTTTDQIVDQFVVLTFRPTVLDRHILAPDKTGLTEAPPKCGQTMNVTLRNPITGAAGCCARAASGQAAAAPPSVAKNFRRPMWLAMSPSGWGSFMQWTDDTTLPSSQQILKKDLAA